MTRRPTDNDIRFGNLGVGVKPVFDIAGNDFAAEVDMVGFQRRSVVVDCGAAPGSFLSFFPFLLKEISNFLPFSFL